MTRKKTIRWVVQLHPGCALLAPKLHLAQLLKMIKSLYIQVIRRLTWAKLGPKSVSFWINQRYLDTIWLHWFCQPSRLYSAFLMLQEGPAPVFWIRPVKPALDHSTGSHYPLVSYVLEQQLHIGFTVKSAFTGVDAIPVDKLVIFSGEHVFPPDRRCHLFLNVSTNRTAEKRPASSLRPNDSNHMACSSNWPFSFNQALAFSIVGAWARMMFQNLGVWLASMRWASSWTMA